MDILNEIEGILKESKTRKRKKLLVKEKWMVEEVHPLFKDKFPNITSEYNLDKFLGWAKKKNFSKKELGVITMARETVLPDQYKTVWTEDDLNELAGWLGSLDKVAIDTETTGVDKYRDEIVGISFYAPHQGYYIPLKHVDDINQSEEAMQEYIADKDSMEVGVDYVECLPLELVARVVGKELKRTELKQIYHNYGFDYHIIRRYLGVKVNCYYDTMIAQAVLDENHPKTLKEMATTYLKIPSDSFSTLFGKR